MQASVFADFELKISEHIKSECEKVPDPTHDFLHVMRVVNWAKKIARAENADLNVVVPAAYLHDVVNVPKNDPRRKEASRLSADSAVLFLSNIGYPQHFLPSVHHAITAHSFSAGIEAKSLEAKVVQDADRLDGLGAIGVARCFATAGKMGRTFYSEEDAFCLERPANDALFTLDHFYVKLFKSAEMLQTESGRLEGIRRVKSMRRFLEDLKLDL